MEATAAEAAETFSVIKKAKITNRAALSNRPISPSRPLTTMMAAAPSMERDFIM